jgi:hypothetical protein
MTFTRRFLLIVDTLSRARPNRGKCNAPQG